MHKEKSYKLVFEIEEEALCIGVITLFRQKIKKGEQDGDKKNNKK